MNPWADFFIGVAAAAGLFVVVLALLVWAMGDRP